jgi:hypothetical protein
VIPERFWVAARDIVFEKFRAIQMLDRPLNRVFDWPPDELIKAIARALAAEAKVAELEAERDASTPHRNREYSTNPLSDERLAEMCNETRWWKTDGDEIYRVVHELKDCRSAITEQAALELRLSDQHATIVRDAATIERLRGALQEAEGANERDRTLLHRAVHDIDSEIKGRMWLLDGRGCYEWDDDKYRQEFGWAVNAIEAKLEVLRKISGDLKNCPKSDAEVAAALNPQPSQPDYSSESMVQPKEKP